jgi:hypothetical protein
VFIATNFEVDKKIDIQVSHTCFLVMDTIDKLLPH